MISMVPLPVVMKKKLPVASHAISFTSNRNLVFFSALNFFVSMMVIWSSLLPTATCWLSGLHAMLMFSPLGWEEGSEVERHR